MSRGAAVPVMDDPSAFRQQVRMAVVQVDGLDPSELEMALPYEVEPSSGVPAAEAELGFRLIADDDPTVRVYDVAVRRRRANSVSGAERFVWPLAIAGAAVLVLLAADAAHLLWARSRLVDDVSERECLDAKIKAVKREARVAREEAQSVRARREAAAKAQDDVSRYRAAWPKLLGAIAEACGEKAVLTSLAADGQFRVKMTATAVSPRAAADVMVSLTAAAEKLGWRVTPGASAASARGTTTTFDCEIEYD